MKTEQNIDRNRITIRTASSEEMLLVWGYQPGKALSPTARFFTDHIDRGTCDFYALCYDDVIIGEIYVFWDLDDKDFANGRDRAYLCAFRVQKEYRHQGLGTILINAVIEKVKERGYTEVTIGVDETEEDNIRLYRRVGFEEKVKDCDEDPCDVGENGKAKKCRRFLLLRKGI